MIMSPAPPFRSEVRKRGRPSNNDPRRRAKGRRRKSGSSIVADDDDDGDVDLPPDIGQQQGEQGTRPKTLFSDRSRVGTE